MSGGLVVLDAATGIVKRTIALQYNPDSLTRSYQVQGAGGEGGGERAQPFRLKGPAIETIKLDAETDGSDQLRYLDQQVHVRLVHQVQDGMLYTIEGNRRSNVQGFFSVR